VANHLKEPTVIARADHVISRANVSDHALKVLYRLKSANYQAYLVGGCVRDLLLGLHPKDFDVATDARPEQVKALFSNCRLIGRRFLLAHVLFGRDLIEVATFRGTGDAEENSTVIDADTGRLLRDNVYGSMEEDAWRRDFTVNALYYNIQDFAIYDYVGGLEDLQQRILRLIGDPQVRYREDPVRMLRAVRLAAKLDFTIEEASAQGILELGHLLDDISSARLFDEFQKLFFAGHAVRTFEMLREYGLFGRLFPQTEAMIQRQGEQGAAYALVHQAMAGTDVRIAQGKPVTPAFLLAALLWPAVCEHQTELMARGVPVHDALNRAAAAVADRASERISIPRRYRLPMLEIWQLQPRLLQRRSRRSLQLLARPRFRAAYDFLLLRAQADEVPQELAQWWTQIQTLDQEAQLAMINTAPAEEGKPHRRRRRGPRRKSITSG